MSMLFLVEGCTYQKMTTLYLVESHPKILPRKK
jgi:hypothetical protein